MKTKLFSLAIALLSLAKLSMAQDAEPPTQITEVAPILEGSLLCGNEVKRISSVHKVLTDKWYQNTITEIDTVNRKIFLRYNFKTPDASLPLVNPFRDTLITTLNEKLPKNIDLHLNEAHLDWSFKEQYLLDDTLYNSNLISVIDFDFYLRKANPFQKCFTINNVCDKLQVVRHEVRPICPSYGVFTKYNISVAGSKYSVEGVDNVTYSRANAELSFVDSIAQYAVVCLAVGNIIKTDTIDFVNLGFTHFESFKINEKVTHIIYCVTTPCNPIIYNLVYNLGEVKLPSCIKTGIENDHFTNEVVYPNPATEKLFVKGVSNITLIDVLGNKSTLKGNGEFDIDGFKSGLYLLNYEINGENYSTKILIQ